MTNNLKSNLKLRKRGVSSKLMKFLDSRVVFQEIPNMISLAFNITNCPNRCRGCHTPELQQDVGEILTLDVLQHQININSDLIDVVLFLGGDNNIPELINLCKYIKYNYPLLKLAMYSGCEFNNELGDILDFYKTGSYIEELGGLNSQQTNQKFFIKNNQGTWENHTVLFNQRS